MTATTQAPFVVSQTQPSSRFIQFAMMAVGFIITGLTAIWALVESHNSDSLALFICIGGSMLLMSVTMMLVYCYRAQFLFVRHKVIKMSSWFGYKWMKEYPIGTFHAVRAYTIDGKYSGHFVQLTHNDGKYTIISKSEKIGDIRRISARVAEVLDLRLINELRPFAWEK